MLLYLFQALPIEVPQQQFVGWNRIISRFVWGGKRPRIRMDTLWLPKEEGGRGLPHIKEYFHAAQLYVIDWCKPAYTAKWKEVEMKWGENPILSILGEEEIYKKTKNQMDGITKYTLKVWFNIIKRNKTQKDIKLFR